MSQHKAEAIQAVRHVMEALASEEPSLKTRIQVATLGYAVEQIQEIVEVKRVRKSKGLMVIDAVIDAVIVPGTEESSPF